MPSVISLNPKGHDLSPGTETEKSGTLPGFTWLVAELACEPLSLNSQPCVLCPPSCSLALSGWGHGRLSRRKQRALVAWATFDSSQL